MLHFWPYASLTCRPNIYTLCVVLFLLDCKSGPRSVKTSSLTLFGILFLFCAFPDQWSVHAAPSLVCGYVIFNFINTIICQRSGETNLYKQQQQKNFTLKQKPIHSPLTDFTIKTGEHKKHFEVYKSMSLTQPIEDYEKKKSCAFLSVSKKQRVRYIQ